MRKGKLAVEQRIGFGIDVHRFKAGRPLILGGLEIPNAPGLDGHSDADVVIHALIDAILGALASGDIGDWFPDTDARYKGADSTVLLEQVISAMHDKGWDLGNCDLTVVAEKPKLGPYKDSMRERLSSFLAVTKEQVSVKATTSEKLGYIGREEGICCHAVVLLAKKPKPD